MTDPRYLSIEAAAQAPFRRKPVNLSMRPTACSRLVQSYNDSFNRDVSPPY